MDKLAADGVRYSHFTTTALCSPTRACLLTGRNHHSVGVGHVMNFPSGYPGYNSHLKPSAGTLAEILGEYGYSRYALGKWHLTPAAEMSAAGPFDRWPSGEGFDHAYTFMAADVHQFVPVMWNDHSPEPYRKSVHLDQDLADRAIEWITGHKSIKPDLPFMMLWASLALLVVMVLSAVSMLVSLGIAIPWRPSRRLASIAVSVLSLVVGGASLAMAVWQLFFRNN